MPPSAASGPATSVTISSKTPTFAVDPVNTGLIAHQPLGRRLDIRGSNQKQPSVPIGFTVGQPGILHHAGIDFHDDAIDGCTHIRQMIPPLQPPADFVMIQFLAHQGELKAIGLTEDLQGKIVQPDTQIAAAFDAGPGVAIVEMVVAGNIEPLDRIHPG